MTRINMLFVGWMCVCAAACNNAAGPIEQVAKQTQMDAANDSLKAPDQDEPALDDENDSPAATAGRLVVPAVAGELEELELAESGVRFMVPASWKRVKPQTHVVEAEFELPRAADDEYDARLTLMSAGGEPQENIGNRKSEFKFEPGEAPGMETMTIDGREASLIDLRGEFKAMFAKEPTPPRAGYRMLYLVVPHSARSGFYAKLTGPRATIAEHEAAFREFIRSAKFNRPATK